MSPELAQTQDPPCAIENYERDLKKMKVAELKAMLSKAPALPEGLVVAKLKKDNLVEHLLKIRKDESASRSIPSMFKAKQKDAAP